MFAESLLVVSAAALVAAQSETTSASGSTPTGTTGASGEPCAVVAEYETTSSFVPAQFAYECLQSVPVDQAGNSALIDELKVLWQWQSEYGYLKNTPEDWEYGNLDIDAELDNIKNNLGSFASELDVQIALQNITTKTGNYHFNYQPDILQVFSWERDIGVVSLSEDGKQLPKLYTNYDAQALSSGENVSEITQINGQDPYDYLKRLGEWEQYLDTDGRINTLLYKGDTDMWGSFARHTAYDGPSTNFTFANGSTLDVDNWAQINYPFDGVSDGESFFEQFCTGSIISASFGANTKDKENDDEEEDDAPKPSLIFPDRLGPHAHIPHSGKAQLYYPGRLGPQPHIPHSTYHRRNKRQSDSFDNYPTAVIEAESGAVAGYFLSGTGYEDVAVLKIITFSPDGDDTGNEFQSVIRTFLSECESQQKTKLIIDLRENGGGATHLLLDAFMQLFPEMEPFSGQRYRITPQFSSIGDSVEEIYKSPDLLEQYELGTLSYLNDTFRYWSYWNFRNAQGENFDSWDEFNGPLNFNSDSFTQTMRYNYSNNDITSIRVEDFYFVNGTRPTIFSPENVLMYTDALCGSSCASFHEELKNIAGVHSVTVGGRPENRPIQAVTGTKGGEVVPVYFFPLYASTMINVTEVLRGGTFNVDAVEPTANASQVMLRAGNGQSRLQSQDQVRKGEKEGVPLQFIYEAADCKVFYTAESWVDPDAAWKQAWDAFADDSKCVEGSTKHASSISGGYKPYGPGALKAEDEPEGEEGSQSGGGSGGGNGEGEEDAAAGLRASAAMMSLVVAVVVALLL
ncbi:hypothetical protein BS50DRAFT_609174 [Corynespora cassiicola Philippines]|uniref:Uncharacterized protein n=1 Tax=Corynespora cassiicola Philippines TaxID=1448308 RepID=A0A2T2NTW1_CORCC|nr:hypothetical protein BS50DRAFT_609174 [Corynespora cassiicola Philippines]